MALTNLYMDTDTGGGTRPGTNTSKLVKQTNPYTSTSKTPASTAYNAAVKNYQTTKAATSSKAATSTPATTSTAKKKTYTSSYTPRTYYSSGGGSSGGGSTAEQPKTYYNDYLRMLDSIYDNEYKTITGAADSYKAAALQNITGAENQANSAYNTNKSLLDQLAAQNAQREQATMDAINSAYNAIIGNADNYYNSLLDTYNRSMDYVNQGFDEGNQVSAQARDEALELAAQIYQMGEDTQNRETERALKGQYGSYMKGMRNLNQKLAAMGYNGGATETSMLNALNEYESNRTDLNEAKLSALGQLRQQQMQSDADAQMTYLNKVADLIANRTNQQLGVEQNRSTGEYNYAGMKNEAESNRSSQTVNAQNNFQNWAANLTGQRTSNENSYADAVRQLMESKNTVEYNNANMTAQASQSRSQNYGGTAYSSMVEAGGKSKKTKEKEKKAKEKEKKKTSSTKSSTSKTTTKATNAKTIKKSTKKK